MPLRGEGRRAEAVVGFQEGWGFRRSEMSSRINRRDFLKNAGNAGAAGVGFWIAGRQPAWAQEKGPNAKLNVACIGTGGRGYASVEGCSKETIVALCDIDENRLNKAGEKFKDARKYTDYRIMLEKEEKN